MPVKLDDRANHELSRRETPLSPSAPRRDYHAAFAALYDTLYRERDIEGEAADAAALLGVDDGGDREILDFGCGTGSHALALAKRGVSVTGYDVSEAMIAIANDKRRDKAAARLTFASGTFDSFRRHCGGRSFDGAMSLFNVFNCMPSPAVMLDHLRGIRSQLADGARTLIEVWNGAAVFLDAPRPDVKHLAAPGHPSRELVRILVPELDRIRQSCRLKYRILTLDRADGSFTEFESVHDLLFLTPVQYRHLFELAEFEVLDEFPKRRPGQPIDAGTWYISYLLRAHV